MNLNEFQLILIDFKYLVHHPSIDCQGKSFFLFHYELASILLLEFLLLSPFHFSKFIKAKEYRYTAPYQAHSLKPVKIGG